MPANGNKEKIKVILLRFSLYHYFIIMVFILLSNVSLLKTNLHLIDSLIQLQEKRMNGMNIQ